MSLFDKLDFYVENLIFGYYRDLQFSYVLKDIKQKLPEKYYVCTNEFGTPRTTMILRFGGSLAVEVNLVNLRNRRSPIWVGSDPKISRLIYLHQQ